MIIKAHLDKGVRKENEGIISISWSNNLGIKGVAIALDVLAEIWG